jgi:hypothetical protein
LPKHIQRDTENSMTGPVNSVLHITVGAAPRSELNLAHELNLVKAALLYADRVKLCSVSSSMAVGVSLVGSLDDDGLFELIQNTASSLGHDPNDIAHAWQLYDSLRRKKRRNRQELLMLDRLKRQLKQSREELQHVAERTLVEANADGLAAALGSGLVELQWFDVSKDNVVEEYFAAIVDSILSSESYPLLDDATGSLVNAAIKEGKLIPLGATVGKAKQVGLSTDLFSRLPLFDIATVDEIIDIRRELDAPLRRFRAAVIGFSKEVENAPWDRDFSHEADQIFIEYVEPAVLEIEEATKSNKLLLDLIARSLTYGIAAPSALGILLSHMSQLPDILGGLSAITGATLGAYEAVKKHREKREEIEQSQLYFYYKAGKTLEKQHS